MGIRIEWFGTASFRLRAEGVTVLLDPWVTRNPFAKPPKTTSIGDLAVGAMAVFLSHGHFDHVADLPELLKLNPTLEVHGPASAISRLRERVPAAAPRLNVVSRSVVKVGKAISVNVLESAHVHFDVALVVKTLLRAMSSPASKDHLRYGLFRDYPCGETLTYVIDCGSRYRIHFLGSAGPDDRMLDQWGSRHGKVDCLLLPLQGNSRICEIGARIVEKLRPKLVIPHHHDDFYPPISESVDISEFKRIVGERTPGARVLELEIGEPCELTQSG
jgi:L-ascorbate metabolism protein UlaG (beta-lactamase superfamily)